MAKPVLGIFFGLLMVFLLPGTSLPEVLFSPSWQVGDQWTVEVVYPDPLGKGQGSKPVHWEYRVAAEEEGSAGNGLLLVARGTSEENGGTALTLLFRSGDYRLLKAESTKFLRGKEIVKVFQFEGTFPVETLQSPVPYDFPVFPIQVPSSLSFSFPKEISGGMKKIETVRQEVRKVSADSVDLPGGTTGKEFIEIRCEDTQGNEIFLQYWDPSAPWPVYGRNLNMHYRLIEK